MIFVQYYDEFLFGQISTENTTISNLEEKKKVMLINYNIMNWVEPSEQRNIKERKNKDICGVIKQNQSEVGHIQFSVSNGIVTSICKATFCRKPHWNWTTSSKDISN